MSPHCALHTCETAPCPREMWPSAVSRFQYGSFDSKSLASPYRDALVLLAAFRRCRYCPWARLGHTGGYLKG